MPIQSSRLRESGDISILDHLQKYFYKKCPFESRPIRELTVLEEKPRMIHYRDSYNGAFTTSVVIPPKQKQRNPEVLPDGQFELPNLKYHERLPIALLKYQNLQDLKKFCENPDARHYFSNLPYAQNIVDA